MWSRFCRRGAIVVALGLTAASCTGPVPPVLESSPTDRPCTVAAVRSCALPYPSDEFVVEDSSMPSGRRLAVPAGILPESLTSQLGPGAKPSDAFAGADGYSALSPVMIEVEHPLRPHRMPSDGGDVMVVYDAETGERMPIRAEVPADPARYGAPDSVVVAWPKVRYEYGRTYIARLGDSVSVSGNRELAKPAGLSDLDDARTAALRADIERIEGPGAWEHVVSATRFTIRTHENATDELDTMAAIARSEDHPIRITGVERPLLLGPDIAALVHGKVLVSDFRDGDGVARAANGSTPKWIPFVMTLPAEPASDAGAPVVIYGHGLMVAKETMIATASANAAKGMATIGIDVPNHGERVENGFLLDLTQPRRFGRLVSMTTQGVIDHVSLLMAVEQHLSTDSLVIPAGAFGRAEPAPTLDTSTLLYEGTSMGGVLGGSFVALAPELDGAFLQVAGTGVADIIFHSLLWPLFMGVVPRGAGAGDALAMMASATMLLDTADNVNVFDRVRPNDTPVFLIYGVGDQVVPSFTSDRMLALADLPLTGRNITGVDVEYRIAADDGVPADGWGFSQIWAINSSDELRPFLAHLAFTEARSERLLLEWLDGRLAAEGITG